MGVPLPHRSRLPPGRHGLPRHFVVHSQRERILRAVAESVAARGYAGMTIADVVGRAEVSRRTFYEQFGSKEGAVRAAYDAAVEQLANVTLDALAASGDWRARLRAATDALLEFLAAEPAFTRLTLVEIGNAGAEARSHHRRTVGTFATAIDRLRPPTDAALPEATTRVVVGGVEQLMLDLALDGRTAQLPTLRPTIMFLLLVPWLGREEARRELDATVAQADETSADRRASASEA